MATLIVGPFYLSRGLSLDVNMFGVVMSGGLDEFCESLLVPDRGPQVISGGSEGSILVPKVTSPVIFNKVQFLW